MVARVECDGCNRGVGCRGPVRESVLGVGGDVMVLGECPNHDDEAAGVAFAPGSECGEYLRKILHQISDDVVLAHATRCYNEGKPTPKQAAACGECWRALVSRYKPKVLVAAGKAACEAVVGHTVKITNEVGRHFDAVINDHTVRVVLSYSPAYILHTRRQKGGKFERIENEWFATWDTVQSLLTGEVQAPPQVSCLYDVDDILTFLDALVVSKERFSYDYETWGDRDARRPELNNDFKIVCIGVATKTYGGVAFPVGYRQHFKPKDRQRILKAWRRVLESELDRLAHNAKYEHKCNIRVFDQTWHARCTQLRMCVLDELAGMKLEQVAQRCNIPWANYKHEMRNIQERPEESELEPLLQYCGLDCVAALEIDDTLTAQLEEEGTDHIAHMQEMFCVDLAWLEMTGMFADHRAVAEVREEYGREYERALASLRKHPAVKRVEAWALRNIKSFKQGSEFNPDSPKQVFRLCHDELHLQGVMKRKPGSRDETISYDKKALEPYEDHPVVSDLLLVRSTSAMITGFLDKYDQFTGPSGCVHTQYNQTVVTTGRLSSSDPNLQNIPNHSSVRRVFVPRWRDDGWVIHGDFSQLEPRLLAGWSRDAAMVHAITRGLDLHTYVAAEINKILGKPWSDYDELQAAYKAKDPDGERVRHRGKRMNLGVMYGQTEHGLSRNTDMSLDEAVDFIAAYDKRFEGVAKFRLGFHRFAIRKGYVEDLFGGRRHLPGAQSDNKWEQGRALRQASNAPIQSTGNRFCLISLHALRQLFWVRQIEAIATATVHDSLDAETRNQRARDLGLLAMYDAMLLHNDQPYWCDSPVPMKVDLAFGRNLRELESASDLMDKLLAEREVGSKVLSA